MSISTDLRAATSPSSEAEHLQLSLRHYFMKRAPTSAWSSIELHTRMQSSRTLAQKIRRPISTIGPGWKSRFFSDLPLIFHHLPRPVQNRLVKGFLGPAGGWFLRGRFDHVPLLAGYQIKGAEVAGHRAVLWLKSGKRDAPRI